MLGGTRRVICERWERPKGQVNSDLLHETRPPAVQGTPPELTLPRTEDIRSFDPQQAAGSKDSDPFAETTLPVGHVFENRIGEYDVERLLFKRKAFGCRSLISDIQILDFRAVPSKRDLVRVNIHTGDFQAARLPVFGVEAETTANIQKPSIPAPCTVSFHLPLDGLVVPFQHCGL